jgi:transcriptional regulator with XRE-family HTH domain
MTGEEIGLLRKALGLELAWFASLLGLQAEKLARWEASEEVLLHPLQAHILSILEVQVRRLGPLAPDLGRRILVGVMLYGPPYGLLVLLQEHYAGRVPEFVPSGAAGPSSPRDPV